MVPNYHVRLIVTGALQYVPLSTIHVLVVIKDQMSVLCKYYTNNKTICNNASMEMHPYHFVQSLFYLFSLFTIDTVYRLFYLCRLDEMRLSFIVSRRKNICCNESTVNIAADIPLYITIIIIQYHAHITTKHTIL